MQLKKGKPNPRCKMSDETASQYRSHQSVYFQKSESEFTIDKSEPTLDLSNKAEKRHCYSFLPWIVKWFVAVFLSLFFFNDNFTSKPRKRFVLTSTFWVYRQCRTFSNLFNKNSRTFKDRKRNSSTFKALKLDS